MLTAPWKTHRCSLMQITLSQNLQKIVQIVEFVLCSESLNLNCRLFDDNSFFLITRKSKIKNRKLSSQCSFSLVRGQTIEVLISERVLYCGTTSILIADQPFIPLVSSPTPPTKKVKQKEVHWLKIKFQTEKCVAWGCFVQMYNRNMTTSCQCTETTSDHNTLWSLGNETYRLYTKECVP